MLRRPVRKRVISRFDVLRDANDPCTFQLYEVYVDRAAQQAHLASTHFAAWKEAVLDVFAGRSIQNLRPCISRRLYSTTSFRVRHRRPWTMSSPGVPDVLVGEGDRPAPPSH